MLSKKFLVLLMLISIILVQVFSVSLVRADELSGYGYAYGYGCIVNIKDFGAHSIDEKGYETFDSSDAINQAIQYARSNSSDTVDFGEGRYFATRITLESNITYLASKGAMLIASPKSKNGTSLIQAFSKNNIVINGLILDGNWDMVSGSDQSGCPLISLFNSQDVTIENSKISNNKYVGVLLSGSNNILIKNNTIFDTDCGVVTLGTATNNLVIDKNEIYGGKNQTSEPVSIFNNNSNGLAHDISITNNILHDKKNADGILVRNAQKVNIVNNTIYNVAQGIRFGEHYSNENQFMVSTDCTITGNNIYNTYYGGMLLEIDNSLISDNVIHDIKGSGIWLTSKWQGLVSENNILSNNKITNVNSDGGKAPGIRLTSTKNSNITGNSISDTRNLIKNYANIQITGNDNDNNTIKNNFYGKTTNKYAILVSNGAKNTIINEEKIDILDQGDGTKVY